VGGDEGGYLGGLMVQFDFEKSATHKVLSVTGNKCLTVKTKQLIKQNIMFIEHKFRSLFNKVYLPRNYCSLFRAEAKQKTPRAD
jgi:hypothetical protein